MASELSFHLLAQLSSVLASYSGRRSIAAKMAQAYLGLNFFSYSSHRKEDVSLPISISSKSPRGSFEWPGPVTCPFLGQSLSLGDGQL